MSDNKKIAYRLVESFSSIIEENFILSEIKENQYAFERIISKDKEQVKILVYFGKSGVKTVLQGDKTSEVYTRVKNLVYGDTFFENNNDSLTEPESYIGTDESGKGDYFGPLVVAGVFINPESSKRLKILGIKDSKLLSDSFIKDVVPEMFNILGDDYHIITISPKTYNELHMKMGNVNRLLGWAHAKVIETLLTKRDVKDAITDKFGDESYVNRHLGEKGKLIKLHQVVRAEKYTAVAAASVLARYSFNKWFKEKSSEGLVLPKGASSLVDSKVREIKQKYDIEFLKGIAKLHFKTTNK